MNCGNKADVIYFDEILDKIFDTIWEDVFGNYDCSHMWTFAEFKSPSEKIKNVRLNKNKISYKWVDIGGILNEDKGK